MLVGVVCPWEWHLKKTSEGVPRQTVLSRKVTAISLALCLSLCLVFLFDLFLKNVYLSRVFVISFPPSPLSLSSIIIVLHICNLKGVFPCLTLGFLLDCLWHLQGTLSLHVMFLNSIFYFSLLLQTPGPHGHCYQASSPVWACLGHLNIEPGPLILLPTSS